MPDPSVPEARLRAPLALRLRARLKRTAYACRQPALVALLIAVTCTFLWAMGGQAPRPRAAWTYTPQSCAIEAGTIERVTDAERVAPNEVRLWTDGPHAWYGLSLDEWPIEVKRDVLSGYGFVQLQTRFLGGSCLKRAIVHLPCPGRHRFDGGTNATLSLQGCE
jgi:hypothetical protein